MKQNNATSLITVLLLILSFVMAGCTQDQILIVRQNAGLVAPDDMHILVSDDGTHCYGGEVMTRQQKYEACDIAMQNRKLQMQQEQAEKDAQVKRDLDRKKIEEEENKKRIAKIQANASPKLLRCEKIVTGLAQSYALAQFSMMCNIRSAEWHSSLTTGLTMSMLSEIRRARLTEDEELATNAIWNKVINETLRKQQQIFMDNPRNACRDFMSGPEIDRLDRMQNQITGNYH